VSNCVSPISSCVKKEEMLSKEVRTLLLTDLSESHDVPKRVNYIILLLELECLCEVVRM